MELSAILPHVEALIFASEKPLTSLELTELINNALGFLDDKITLDQIESAVAGVIEKYDADFYPFEIRESGGGWQFLTKKDYHKTVAQLNGDKFLKRLSAASLETLAIIAYKQPITKGEIESIRGVNSDYSIQKLLEKELIIITGRNEELPGKPLVYATSKTFMDYFGINSPDELPSIKDVLSSQVLEPSQAPQRVSDGLFADADSDEEIPSANNESSEDEGSPDDLILTDEDISEGDLVVRANGELTEEPEVVVEDMAEVIEPEQLLGEEEPDDMVAERIEDETGDDDSYTENSGEDEEEPGLNSDTSDEVDGDISRDRVDETITTEDDGTDADEDLNDDTSRNSNSNEEDSDNSLPEKE